MSSQKVRKESKQQIEEGFEKNEQFELALGEYFLHIYLMETTGLFFSEGELDAIIKIEAFGEEQYSQIKKKLGQGSQTFWGEHFFFQKKFDVRQELENSNYTVTVFDHSSILKNTKIGQTSASVSSIYSEKDHTIMNKWSILMNTEKNYKLPMGFVKYSVNFVKAGDKRQNLELQNFGGKENSFSQLAIPPNIKLNQKQLTIQIFKGNRLVDMDIGGGADPYVKFDLGGLKIKTDYKKSTLEPVFMRRLLIPTIYPTIVNNLKMSYKDHDTFGKNEYIGSFDFNLEDIRKGVYQYPMWNYFYGAYENTVDKDIKHTMNKYPEMASRFKGALLISIMMQDKEETHFRSEELEKEDQKLLQSLEKIKFKAVFDIDYIQNLKSKPESHYIELNWGGKIVKSSGKSYNRGVITFFERLVIEEEFEIQKQGVFFGQNFYNQLPDIILSVVYDGKHLSYYRFRPENLSKFQDNFNIVQNLKLNADNSVSELQDNAAGIIQLKCCASEVSKFHELNWPDYNSSSNFEKVRIICYIFQAKDLVPSDDDGSGDPVVQIYHLGSLTKTSTFPKTLNPSWNQKMVLDTFLVNNQIPNIVINVWDKDYDFLGDVEHEFMGSCTINLTESNIIKSRQQLSKVPNSIWHKLFIRKNEQKGEILCGFAIIKQNLFSDLEKTGMMNKINVIPIPSSKHHIKINILGLRNLQSSGLLPIKNVEVKINTSSLQKVDRMKEGAAFTELIAVSKGGGKNPTIGTVLSLTVSLPIDIARMPVLSCQVLDKGLTFWKKWQVIGTFQITLGDFIDKSMRNLLKKLQNVKEIKTKKEKMTKKLESQIDGITKYIKTLLKNQQGFIMENSQFQLETVTLQDQITEVFEKKEKDVQNFYGLKGDLATQQKGDDSNETNMDLVEMDQPQKGMFTGYSNIGKKLQSRITHLTDVVIKPNYVIQTEKGSRRKLQIEQNHPNPKEFLELGYDTKTKKKKHYRRYVEENLEATTYMGGELFSSIDIMRGKMLVDKKGFFEKFFSLASHKEEHYRKTGSFRGTIDIIDDVVLQQLIDLDLTEEEKTKLELPNSLTNWKYSQMDEEILRSEAVIIRLYIIDASYYKNLDIGSQNDSFFKIKFGDKKFESSKRIDNNNNPKFNMKFEFEHSFPGASDLIIKFYDHDPIKTNELIGETSIDLEKRFFDQKWRSFDNKPIETRTILHPSQSQESGRVRLWVEMFPKSEMNNFPGYDISSRAQTNIVLRIVIWEVHDVPVGDFEDVSDIYIACTLPSFDLTSKTDTHFRAQNNYGSFNWRLVYKIKINENCRQEHYRLNLRVYDKDFLSGDDFSSDGTLDISDIVNYVLENEQRKSQMGQSIDGDISNEFVLKTLVKKTRPEDKDQFSQIVLSIDAMTEKESEISPAGIGRSDPNQDPYLHAPTSRFVFSLNPFKVVGQLCGPQFKKNLCFYICVGVIFIFFIVFLPTLIAAIVAAAIV